MIKSCQQCGKEYESTQKAGQEQRYCSKSCRNKAANERRESVLAEKLKRQIHGTTESRDESTTTTERYPTIRNSNFGIPDIKIFELVSENANLTAENKRLQEKIQTLEIENGKLIAEVEQYEDDDDDGDGNMGSIGKVVEQYMPVIVPAIVSIFAPKQPTQQKPPTNNAQTQTTRQQA